LLDDRKPEENYVVEIQAATSIGWGTLVKKTTTTVAWAGKLVNCNTPKECVNERENCLPRGKAAHHARVLFPRGRRLLLLLSCYFRSTILEWKETEAGHSLLVKAVELSRGKSRVRVNRVRTGPGKSWNFILAFSRTGKSWKIAVKFSLKTIFWSITFGFLFRKGLLLP